MTTARRRRALLGALAALAAGCGGALGTPPCQDGSCDSQTSTKTSFTYTADRRIDLLFVVDDTAAIAPHADRVATGLAAMADALQSAAIPLSLHVGFVRGGSCDTSTRSRACGIDAPTQFVKLQPCNQVTNASGAFVDIVACLGALGAGDCAPTQPMAAALQALDPANAVWDGFLRPDAYLDVVIVAATDDASGPPGAPTSALDVARRLKALKADPSQVLVTVIGPGDCAAGDVQGPRLRELADEFGQNGLYMNLCDDPLSAAVDRLGELAGVGRIACLTNVRDTDPAASGLQPSCTVVQRNTDTGTGISIEQKIPSCNDGPPPCWYQPQPGPCSGTPGWTFGVEGPLNECVDGTVSIEFECLACADPSDPACALPP